MNKQNVPDGATHHQISTNTYFKVENGEMYYWDGAWWVSVFNLQCKANLNG